MNFRQRTKTNISIPKPKWVTKKADEHIKLPCKMRYRPELNIKDVYNAVTAMMTVTVTATGWRTMSIPTTVTEVMMAMVVSVAMVKSHALITGKGIEFPFEGVLDYNWFRWDNKEGSSSFAPLDLNNIPVFARLDVSYFLRYIEFQKM